MTLRPANLIGRTRPDNTDQVARTDRAQSLSRFEVAAGENLKVFALYFAQSQGGVPWYRPPLAPGSTAGLIDFETGQQISTGNPYTISPGIDSELVDIYTSGELSVEMDLLADFPDAGDGLNTIATFNASTYDGESFERPVEYVRRSFVDPDLQGDYDVAVELTNKTNTTESLIGSYSVSLVETQVSTPPFPTEFDYRCWECGAETTDDWKKTTVECSECGSVNRYMTLPRHDTKNGEVVK